jgi:hypothetical protein
MIAIDWLDTPTANVSPTLAAPRALVALHSADLPISQMSRMVAMDAYRLPARESGYRGVTTM